MYRRAAALLLAFLLVGFFPPTAYGAGPINTSRVTEGVVAVEYNSPIPLAPLRVTVENHSRRDVERYVYHLQPGVKDFFPLQMGGGEYLVTVLEHVEGNLYRPLQRDSFVVAWDAAADVGVYLHSVQNIPWNGAAAVCARARELTAETDDTKEQVRSIHQFLVDKMVYDYTKLDRLAPGYLPDVEETLLTHRGICYDFSSLFAALLRSIGIPTKLVMGYAAGVKGYHAWNEVYLGGEWQVVDVTCDISHRAAGQPYSMFKTGGDYQKMREY